MPVWESSISVGSEVLSSIYATFYHLNELRAKRAENVNGLLYDGVGAIINNYEVWDKVIAKWTDEAKMEFKERPDIGRIMHLADAAKESSMPFETDIGGVLVRSETGETTCAKCPKLSEEARVIVDKLLAMDKAFWAKDQMREKNKGSSEDVSWSEDDRRRTIARPRHNIARFIARMYGDKSMDAVSWVVVELFRISESARRFLSSKSDESKMALYSSIKQLAQRDKFDTDEFRPYRQFTAGATPGTATIPEYKGDNVILKGLYKAYKILVGK